MSPPRHSSLSTARTLLSRRTLISLTLLYTLYRNRQPLLTRLRAFARAFARAAHAANLLSLVLAQTSADVQHYLQPTTAPLRRRNNSQPPTAPVPRSLRRLLRLASSPDALAIIHGLAGGLAQGVTREFHTPRVRPSALTPSQYAHSPQEQHAPQRLHELMEALAAPAGQAVVRNVVSTAVREGVHAFADANERRRDPTDRPWPDVLVAGVTSDKGRQLVVEVATSVAKTVVPAVMAAQAAPQGETPSVTTLTPVASPMRRRRPPSCGSSQNGKVSVATVGAGESPISKQLVMSVMQAQGGAGVIERLALLAIRDKALVREVVRAVVSEAVRTYLTTQAKLREQGVGLDAASPMSIGSTGFGKISAAAKFPRQDEKDYTTPPAQQDGTGNSLWKLLIKSAVVDLKRALLKSAPKEGNTGWLIF